MHIAIQLHRFRHTGLSGDFIDLVKALVWVGMRCVSLESNLWSEMTLRSKALRHHGLHPWSEMVLTSDSEAVPWHSRCQCCM